MAGDSIVRRLRGAFGNAVVWGAGWFGLSLATFSVLRLAGFFPESAWADGLLIAARFALGGGVAGAAFSGAIGLLYRGRRLSEISWVRFGVAGALVTGVFVPVFLQTMNWLSGDGFVPVGLVLDDALWTAVFGGVAAAASLRIAQLADTALPAGGPGPLGRLESGDLLAPTREWERAGEPLAAERPRAARG